MNLSLYDNKKYHVLYPRKWGEEKEKERREKEDGSTDKWVSDAGWRSEFVRVENNISNDKTGSHDVRHLKKNIVDHIKKVVFNKENQKMYRQKKPVSLSLCNNSDAKGKDNMIQIDSTKLYSLTKTDLKKTLKKPDLLKKPSKDHIERPQIKVKPPTTSPQPKSPQGEKNLVLPRSNLSTPNARSTSMHSSFKSTKYKISLPLPYMDLHSSQMTTKKSPLISKTQSAKNKDIIYESMLLCNDAYENMRHIHDMHTNDEKETIHTYNRLMNRLFQTHLTKDNKILTVINDQNGNLKRIHEISDTVLMDLLTSSNNTRGNSNYSPSPNTPSMNRIRSLKSISSAKTFNKPQRKLLNQSSVLDNMWIYNKESVDMAVYADLLLFNAMLVDYIKNRMNYTMSLNVEQVKHHIRNIDGLYNERMNRIFKKRKMTIRFSSGSTNVPLIKDINTSILKQPDLQHRLSYIKAINNFKHNIPAHLNDHNLIAKHTNHHIFTILNKTY